jgi:WD40 repeat protein
VAVHPSGRYAVSGDLRGHLLLWDIETGTLRMTVSVGSGAVGGVAYLPDGRGGLSTGGASFYPVARELGTSVWLDRGGVVRSLMGHIGPAVAVAVMPDGRRAITGGEDCTLCVWDVATGEQVGTLRGHGGVVTCVAPLADGVHAVSGSWDATVRLWNTRTGDCLAVYPQAAKVQSVAVGAGRLAVGDHDGNVQLFDVGSSQTGPLIVTARRLWNFGSRRWYHRVPGVKPSGAWAADITARCEGCGGSFAPDDAVLDAIRVIHRRAQTAGSPCLELPPKVWEAKPLLSGCRRCNQPLRFNPFVVDSRNEH